MPLSGGTMNGMLALADDPAGPLDAATKRYVDAALGIGGGPFLPLTGGTLTGNLSVYGPGPIGLQMFGNFWMRSQTTHSWSFEIRPNTLAIVGNQGGVPNPLDRIVINNSTLNGRSR